MTGLLGRIFGGRPAEVHMAPMRGDIAYAAAMTMSDDILERMQTTSRSTDAARAVMADIWSQNHNIPFLTTIIETVQEMKAPIEQDPHDRSVPKSDPS